MPTWQVEYADEFFTEVTGYPTEVQTKIAAGALLLAEFGPRLGRPRVDLLKGSRHANMKELRLDVGQGVWRVAFAFDPTRKAILLKAGNKRGISDARFYRDLIRVADERFDRHLAQLKRRR
jgi:hypothetical protein